MAIFYTQIFQNTNNSKTATPRAKKPEFWNSREYKETPKIPIFTQIATVPGHRPLVQV